jgi:hypothetical protein
VLLFFAIEFRVVVFGSSCYRRGGRGGVGRGEGGFEVLLPVDLLDLALRVGEKAYQRKFGGEFSRLKNIN